jgi:2-(1,2-epoxy-1,2-dihydrophenyl)acetyl-CoA isomerase
MSEQLAEVVVERIERTIVITINRPQARNSLTRPVLHAMREALAAAAVDPEVRCVVIGGSGGHFCAGADLRKNMEDPDMFEKLPDYLDDFHGLIKGIVHCPKPVIAMIDGAAVGFGADIALACDFRVASTTAYLQEKFVKIGLMPDGGGTFWLPRLIGTSRAMQVILLGDEIEHKEMLELGLLVELTSPTELHEVTMALAKKLEAGPPLAHAAVKKALYASLGSVDDALAREREGQLALLRSSDCMEGIMSWAQKRAPEFQGK